MIVVMPMAGHGSRFAKYGERTPKPLIQVSGRPMVAWALESLRGMSFSQIIFVALREHEREFGVRRVLKQLAGKQSEVFLIEDVTEGQLCSVLAVRESLATNEDVLIASADTYIRSSLADDIARRPQDCRGIISVADLPGDQWSFARTDPAGRVVEVAEKSRISDNASTGIYYFSNGQQFLSAADKLIRNREKIRGEYYVIPVYREYIRRGWTVEVSRADEVWDMGTPAALERFERSGAWAGVASEH